MPLDIFTFLQKIGEHLVCLILDAMGYQTESIAIYFCKKDRGNREV